MRRAGRHPVIRHRLPPIDPVRRYLLATRTKRCLTEIGAHIFPHDLACRSHLEEAPSHAFVYESISIWKPSYVANEGGVKRPCRTTVIGRAVFPDDLFPYWVDLNY